ncbi:hypothetical protein OH76DRAFT_1483188 [Lentinus brumalis]|uniref:Uncharacterized protein n=1 Tax=Lentinus brumalis TaxID=2498619 RepID=A0A371D9K7_9APHY|nr:hypothetical protein OH76DRAFT_1483188 [Polyporus brumalis]
MSLAPGSQISVYGRVVPGVGGAQQPLSLYSVGSQKLQAFIPDDVTQAMDNVAFFNSTVMPYGQYTIAVNVTRVDADAPYFFDYFRPGPGAVLDRSWDWTLQHYKHSNYWHNDENKFGQRDPDRVKQCIVFVFAANWCNSVFAFFCYRIRKRKSKIFLSPNGEKMSPTSVTPYILPEGAGLQAPFGRDIPSLPAGAPSMGQYGSTHSLGTAAPSDHRSSKAAMARQERYLHPPGGPSGSSPYVDEYLGAPGSSVHSPSSHSSSHPSSRSHTHSNHTPQSTLRALPTFAPRSKAHAKGM